MTFYRQFSRYRLTQRICRNANVITVTRQGMIKRSAVKDLPGVSVSDFVLCKVNPDIELFQVLISDGNQDVLNRHSQRYVHRLQ